jgi:hypothetical protein
MNEKPSGTWKWWLLVVGLAVAHYVFLILAEHMLYPSRSLRRQLEPSWFYHAFFYVFVFPFSLYAQIFHPEPKQVEFFPLFIFTLLLWGCIWAEPFRRRFGWRPWRFTVRDLLIITTMAAVLLGLLLAST